jgi:hypothetical protein
LKMEPKFGEVENWRFNKWLFKLWDYHE